ncbi:formylglycine-generating enzyme family protein [Klebsiella pneumoniae subsp. pneumoniae]|nr:formylglycine-generating enzyme family protein [Klebsiella pneumoniae subsp. pneumoniae]
MQKGDYSVGVTWQQAKGYCQWLGKESGNKIDLPTEAQWEYAADPEVNIFSFQQIMVSIYHGKNVPGKDELDNIYRWFWFPILPSRQISPNPLVCMTWDLVAQNGPMTGMRQIITLILR